MPHRYRHSRAMGAAVAATAALLVAGLSGSASAGTAPAGSAPTAAETLRTDAAPVALLSAMQRDLGLDRQQAERRLVNEAEAGATAARLRAALGGDYAGAWLRGAESGTLTVATTDADDVAAIEAAGAAATVVRHSLADLDAAKSRLDRAATGRDTTDAPVRYVDVRTNTVTVQAVRPSAAHALLDAAGVDAGLARVEKTAERPRPLYDLRGGEAYYINNSGRCSIGFPVTKGTQQGFATAGHCGRTGASTSGANRVAQGTFQGSIFPGRDMAWVATNSSWTATPYVSGAGGQNVQVTGSTQAPVGASVCRSGSTTGWHCGTVQQHNTSVTYPEGTISGVTRTTVCAEPGDSGGSYISGSQAQGVTSGGSGDCRSGGTTFFQPINPLLQNYGLTLKTTGDGGEDPGEPEEPGGTWAAGTVYQPGDTVTYGGATYRCLQGHQAQQGWQPPNVPALWQRV
ncbi:MULTISPECIES: carbohydrate-binding protein [unclassified Streptomyces]|uniref:carbohydrate-binding protein n=1 Tax=unclassified Streptomyces TaxID=2593676 RepID=UPI00244272F9|nr:carbohydrate-binding protein [Streptomyces sp. DH41]MDG9727609.1 alpha-lytic protease prodomain-containing protein [Streptomyces sp. DH41]